MGCNCIYLTFSLSFYLLVSLFAAKNERFRAKLEKHQSGNISPSLFLLRDNPTQKTRVFYTYNHHGNEPLLAAILASGKYGHVYLQLSFQFT